MGIRKPEHFPRLPFKSRLVVHEHGCAKILLKDSNLIIGEKLEEFHEIRKPFIRPYLLQMRYS